MVNYSESHPNKPLRPDRARERTPSSVGEMIEADKNRMPGDRVTDLPTAPAVTGDPNTIPGPGTPEDGRKDFPGGRDFEVFPGAPAPDRSGQPTAEDQAYADRMVREHSNDTTIPLEEQRKLGREELDRQAEEKAKAAEAEAKRVAEAEKAKADQAQQQADEAQKRADDASQKVDSSKTGGDQTNRADAKPDPANG